MSQQDACRRFEAVWKRISSHPNSETSDPPPRIEEYLTDLSGDEYRQTLKRLIEIDQWYRKERGDQVGKQEYDSRFAEYRDIVDAVFEERVVETPSNEIPPLKCPACGRQTLRISRSAGLFICSNSACGRQAELKPAAMDQAPALGRVSNYDIVGLLGQGGFARVWLAKDILHRDTFVALKIPRTRLDDSMASRFLRDSV